MYSLSRLRNIPLFMLIIVSLAVGVRTFRDYGESFDEAEIYEYAEFGLDSYRKMLQGDELSDYTKGSPAGIHNYYGPAYYMTALVLSRLERTIFPALAETDAWHAVYFSTFLVGGCALYVLARRWMRDTIAFTVILLYMTQPLLWGHAFINPKDSPFMAFFIISVVVGLWMCDNIFSFGAISHQDYAIWKYISRPSILLAGIVLGYTSSIRLLGPLAGLIVICYAIGKYGKKAIPPLLPYTFIAVITMYFTWPFLWPAPAVHLQKSLLVMSEFPWYAKVLFAGKYYSSNALPRSYLPVLLLSQITEPVVFLFFAGCLLMIWELRRRARTDLFFMVLIWFFLPLTGWFTTRQPLYDNFRQLLFILPPIFLVCGIALESIFNYLKNSIWKIILIFVIVAPAVYNMYSLHPYQYIYYNSFVGGVGGAFGRFETDYWFTSYKEAAMYLDGMAPHGGKVVVWKADHLIRHHTRSDLFVKWNGDGIAKNYDFIVLNSRFGGLNLFLEAPIVLSIERDGAILTVVRQASK